MWDSDRCVYILIALGIIVSEVLRLAHPYPAIGIFIWHWRNKSRHEPFPESGEGHSLGPRDVTICEKDIIVPIDDPCPSNRKEKLKSSDKQSAQYEERVKELEDKLEKMRTKNAKLNEEVLRLKREVSTVAKKKRTITTINAEEEKVNFELKRQLFEKDNAIKQLREELEEEKIGSKSVESAHSKLRAQLAKFKSELTKVRKEFTEKLTVEEETNRVLKDENTRITKVVESLYRQEFPDPDPSLWEYIDLENNTRGPFTSSQMQYWYRKGFLYSDLMVRTVGRTDYITLSKLISRNNRWTPFSSADDDGFLVAKEDLEEVVLDDDVEDEATKQPVIEDSLSELADEDFYVRMTSSTDTTSS